MTSVARQYASIAMILALTLLSFSPALAQGRRAYRLTDAQMRQLLRRIEASADRFRGSLDEALNRNRLSGTSTENEINGFVRDFEDSVVRLRERFENRTSTRADAETVLDRAARIDAFMRRNRLGVRAEGDWRSLRAELDQLARAYGIRWRWDVYAGASPGSGNVGADATLTGTYQLDAARSQNPRSVVDQATRRLSASERQLVYNELLARLDPPERLAIERRGRTVTIASTRSPQVTFEADGVERTERADDGSLVRLRAGFNGDRLEINSAGERENNFNVVFDPLGNGEQLRVVRRIYSSRLNQYLTLESIYDRTSNVAQWNVYQGPQSTPVYTGGDTSSGFVIPDGTTIVATLNTNLSTQQTREGDRFTMTVREPATYREAVIEGYVSRVNPPGRITGRAEMTLNFERIRLRDGRTYRFAGIIERIRPVGQEEVQVDNEGAVKEKDSQTQRTVERAAIGTAVGAIIGAIAGGGKGAAIGAILGAGAGAGSVYVQGREHLELMSGTEMTIRASAPR